MSFTTTVQNATYTLSVIGPLTTTFTPPTSCSTTSIAPLSQTGCYPPGFSAAFATSSAELAYYSPGVCPSGYYHATPVSDWLLRADETGVHCCPSYVTQLFPRGITLTRLAQGVRIPECHSWHWVDVHQRCRG